MKKLVGILLAAALLCLCAAALADVALDEAHFDAVFCAMLKEECDSDRNGVLSDAEIAGIVELEINDRYWDMEGNSYTLQSVKGIEYLTALERLRLFNDVPTLDLSHNVNLQELVVCNTVLTSLDISKLKKLEYLTLDCEAMTTVDLRSSVDFSETYLEGEVREGSYWTLRYSAYVPHDDGILYGFMLEVLPSANVLVDDSHGVMLTKDNFPDSGVLAALKEFDQNENGRLGMWDRNRLYGLDLYDTARNLRGLELLPEMPYINLEGSKMTSLDISFLPALENINFSDSAIQKVSLPKNGKLKSLGASKSALTSLDVSSLPNLEVLDVDYCKIKALDLSSNPNLTDLLVRYTELQSLDLTHNNKLTKIDCPASKLTSLKLGNQQNLLSLHCADNPLEKLDISGCPLLVSLVKNTKPESGFFLDFSRPSWEWEKHDGNTIYYLQVNQDVRLITGVDDPTEPPAPTAPTTATVGALKYKLSGKNATVTGPKSKSAKKLTIPATIKAEGKTYKVTEIKANAFKGMKKLTTVVIGKNVKTIGKNAFLNCKKLKTITIKTAKLTAKTVGANAFKGVYKKATVKVPAKKLKTYKTLLVKKGLPKTAKVKK